MPRLVVDEHLGHSLQAFHAPVELCDASGNRLGHFVPAEASLSKTFAADHCPYSLPELAQMNLEQGGRPLSEIWSSLGR